MNLDTNIENNLFTDEMLDNKRGKIEEILIKEEIKEEIYVNENPLPDKNDETQSQDKSSLRIYPTETILINCLPKKGEIEGILIKEEVKEEDFQDENPLLEENEKEKVECSSSGVMEYSLSESNFEVLLCDTRGNLEKNSGNVKIFKCSLCQYHTARRLDLQRHLRTHTVHPVMCVETMSTEAEKSDFDTEHFIAEVESRPALWDYNNDDYCNRDLRRKNWEELVTIFLKKEEASAAEKNEFGKYLQRKWKSLRDCYTRERQRLAKIKNGISVPRKTQYVFYNQLSFLQKVTKGKDTSNMEETASAEEMPSDGEQPAKSFVKVAEAGRRKRNQVKNVSPKVECLVNVLQTGMQSQEEEERWEEDDDDRLFLLSLLNPMKKVPEHLHLGVCRQIMQVIYNAAEKDVSYNLNINQDPYPRPNYKDCILTPLQRVIQNSKQIHSTESLSGTSYDDPEFEDIFQQ